MCRLLEVSVSGFYAWRVRPASARAESDTALVRLIGTIFADHQGRYGVRRVHAELARAGHRVGYKRVQRLMGEAGLASVHPRPYRRTTIAGVSKAGLVDLTEPVNLNEARWFGIYCVLVSGSGGGLIQAVTGRLGGSGGLRTNRSGWAV